MFLAFLKRRPLFSKPSFEFATRHALLLSCSRLNLANPFTKIGNQISTVCNTNPPKSSRPTSPYAKLNAERKPNPDQRAPFQRSSKMASAAQVAANRENAKRPRTLSEETKESLRTRALKHGLTSKRDVDTVLKGEDKQEFETILNALLSEATLGTAQEILLIKMQAENFWKSQRAGRMEAGAMDTSLSVVQLMDKVPMELTEEGFGAALAIAYREHSNWFDKLRRYSTTAEKNFFRVTRELAMIRKAGPQEPIGQPEIGQPEIGYVSQSTETEEIPQATTDPAPEIGCVSQKATPPKLSGPSPEQILKLETMSEAEAFEFLDKLTAPPATNKARY
jgi:hypothetical protein